MHIVLDAESWLMKQHHYALFTWFARAFQVLKVKTVTVRDHLFNQISLKVEK
jgi:hypothetical protein